MLIFLLEEVIFLGRLWLEDDLVHWKPIQPREIKALVLLE